MGEFFRKSAVLQGKRPWRTGEKEKGGQNTDTAFLALRLRVVLDLLINKEAF